MTNFIISPVTGQKTVCCGKQACSACLGVTAHEPRSLSIIRSYLFNKFLLRRVAIGIDIGAHVGMYGIGLKSQVSEMHSFEPAKKAFGALNANSVWYDNITPYNFAVWNKETTLGKIWVEHSEEDKDTKAIALDDFGPLWSKKIDIIKIDAEGAELPAIEGMRKLITKNTDKCMLMAEFCLLHFKKTKTNPKDLFKITKELGFTLLHYAEENLLRMPEQENINLHFVKGE